ncbi:amidase [Rhizobium sp. CC-YZS058]|uniref:amidase n=1 Tax=Rhizobium sp. CC-YZS058 TaxID=3042153 RepID=UPI002B054E0C|nr:amidase [Rhizobium sp. CC-YZS058]MEA3535872.1 amidase [Rhizobium sp. CC-YZS058]
MTSDIHRLSIREMGARLRDGSLSASVILDHYLHRIERLNPVLNAIIHLDAEGARKAAVQADERFAAKAPLSLLDGVPVAVKDNILVAGMPCVWGSRLFADFVADHDELPVRLLREAGAVIVGKTNVPEFTLRGFTGNPVFGVTGNPWDLELTPGGSSGGSVSAVAAGLVPYSLGTDGGGSIRRPAGYTGIVGLKTTISRIPRANGLPPLLADCEVIGPLARSIDDTRLVLSVLARPHSDDQHSLGFPPIAEEAAPVRPLNILFVERFGDAPVDVEIAAICREAAGSLKALGHSVSFGPLPLDLSAISANWQILANAGLAKLAADMPRYFDLVTPPFAEQARAGDRLKVPDYLAFLETIATFRVEAAQLFRDVDVVITPTSAANPWPKSTQFPPIIDSRDAGPRGHAIFTNWVNACGHPGLSVPAGWNAAGLPVGMQIVGAFGADDLLLDLAAQYEGAAPWADRWPAMAG